MRRGAASRAAALVGLLLAGCASTAPLPGEPPWTSGRLLVRIEARGAQPAQSFSSAFDLRARDDSGELRLSSPLGSRLATARWSPGQAWLVTSEGERRFDNLDELAREAVGEALPLAALPDWLAGRPWPSAPHRDTEGGFEQLGWQVSLTRRAQGWIDARRESPPGVIVHVKLDEAPS